MDPATDGGEDDGSNTVFVRNLSYDTTDVQLAQRFENVGPVQKGFVVKDKVGRSRGFGFVKFALEEDANAAVEVLGGAKLNGRAMMLDLAQRKGVPVDRERKKSGRGQDKAGPEGGKQRQRSEKVELAARTLLVWGAPANTTEAELRRTIKNTKGVGEVDSVRLHVPLSSLVAGAEGQVCLVVMKEINDTKLAAPLLSGRKTHGAPIQCRRQIALATTVRAQRQCRLIVRNLPFTATKEALEKEFGAIGPLESVHLPFKEGEEGKQLARGFGFVQFRFRGDAAKAIRTVTGRKIGGRPVVVDWALQKGEYTNMQERGGEEAGGGEEKGEMGASEKVERALSSIPDGDGEEDSGSEGEEGEEDEEDGGEDLEDEEDEEEAGTDEEDEKGEDVGDSASVEAAEGRAEKEQAESDVMEGRTLFLRNVAVDSTEKSIFDRLRKFGPVAYVKLVRDSNSAAAHKGSAFVKFSHRNSADDALRFASSGVGQSALPSAAPGSKALTTALAADVGGIVIDGRKVVVTRAVDRNTALKLQEGAKRKKVDRRHLFLAKEGNIKPSSETAALMPSADLAKRKRAQRDKRTKLRNPLFFVSPTRLSVRNISAAVTDGELKDLFHKACRAGLRDELVRVDELPEDLRPTTQRPPVRIVKAQIAREGGKVLGGAAKSKGFAFVEFSEHLHALAALRYGNNNPEFTPYAVGGKANAAKRPVARPRLIVEFSIENHAALRKQRERKSRAAQSGAKQIKAENEVPEAAEGSGGGGQGAVLTREQRITLAARNMGISRKQLKRFHPAKQKRAIAEALGEEVPEEAKPGRGAASKSRKRAGAEQGGADGPGSGDGAAAAEEEAAAAKRRRVASAAEAKGQTPAPRKASAANEGRRRRRTRRRNEEDEEDRLDRLVEAHADKIARREGVVGRA